jgi:hypothetical protein
MLGLIVKLIQITLVVLMASNVRIHFKNEPQGNVQNSFGVSTNIFVWLNENDFNGRGLVF